MRHIDGTMEKSSHFTDEFPKDQHGADEDENTYYRLYDDMWKSEESDAASLHEVPLDYLDNIECEDTVNNAITEAFSDFLSGKRVNLSPNKHGESDESHSDAEFKSLSRLAYVARYPETAAGMSDNDWNPYGTESDSNISPHVTPNGGLCPQLSDSELSSSTMFNPPLYSTDLNTNTPSVRLCNISDPEANMVSTNEQTENNFPFFLKPDIRANFSSVSHVSDQLSDKPLTDHPAECTDLNKTLRVCDFETSAKFQEYAADSKLFNTDDKIGGNSKNHDLFQDRKTFSGDEHSTQRQQKTLPSSQILGKVKKHRSIVDYNLLHRDLQEIQNSLKNTQGQEVKLNINKKGNVTGSKSRVKTLESSDSECDIIPSTTTTPDRERNKMAWDFAADLGYHQTGDLMGEISLETFITNSHRPSDGKKSYNSDGDETRTSGSSDRVADHALVYQNLTDVSQTLQPQNDNQNSFGDVDMMLFNFRSQREQIECRYQQLNSQGLAEKVCRILSSQNPQSQVNGLLSEISAQEREVEKQLPLKLQGKDLNFSAMEESSHSLALLDSVRKRLDLSGLSSTDGSKLADKSSLDVPVGGNGFTALDGMTKFLSSQMAKALERTFNHSTEKIVPHHVVQCYPLTVDNKPQEKTRNEMFDEDSTNRTSVQTLESGVNRQSNTVQNQNSAHLPDDSDSSSGRNKGKYRPYRPAGSKEVYYTESDVASVADSVTTMESTHFGSDDARGPVLPLSALGSRQDAPNVAGIYGNRVPLFSHEGEILPPIQERSGLDDRETESSQSNKGEKASESLRSQGNEQNGSSNKGSISEKQQGDGSIQSQDNSRTKEKGGISREEETSAHVLSEIADSAEPSPHDEAETRNNDRWANFRNPKKCSTQEYLSRTEDINNNQNKRGQIFEGSSRHDYISRRSRFDEHQLRRDHYKRKRPTDVFVDSEYSDTSRFQRVTYPDHLSLRHPMIHADVNHALETDQRFNYTEDHDAKGLTYSTRNATTLSNPKFYSRISDRSFKSRFGNAEKPFSPQDPYNMNKEDYLSERFGVLSRSQSDDDLYDLGRSAHISPLFRDALSPDFRRAIRNRSPILSRHIERSLSQPPSEWPDHCQRSMHQQNQSPPPLLLNQERGEPSRPVSNTKSDQGRPWSPLLQVRVASSSSSQDDTSQHSQSLHKTESKIREISPASDATEVDQKPVSQRVQLLTQALTHKKDQDIQPNIGSLWEQFKANNESSESLSSSSLDAVTDLILNPSPHLVNQCLKEREENIIERQERAEVEREKRYTEKRLERHLHQNSSEEDVTVGYAELLAEKEMERMKRRTTRKKKGKPPVPVSTKLDVSGMENIADKLFSIPEDASFEQSPKKSFSTPKHGTSKVIRQPHIIDPNMEKLRDRIFRQKQKIDKHTLKEIQRIEKLKKLEQLLFAKRKGEISDQTLEMQLEEISSTTTPSSENSQEGWCKNANGHDTTPLSDDSTTVKDSSNEMNVWKTNKEIRMKEMMKSLDKGHVDKYGTSKTGKEIGLSTKTGIQGANTKYKISNSQIKLLKLVKEGYLTAEEAYRLAVEREAAMEKTSVEASRGSSSDEFHGNSQSSRLHRLYSPYSRDDVLISHKSHYIPKLKYTPSVHNLSGFTYPNSWHKQGSEQSFRNFSTEFDHNDSHPTGSYTGNGYIHPKLSLLAPSEAASMKKTAVANLPNSKPVWQKGRKTFGTSPSRPRSCKPASPIRNENRPPLAKLSPSRREYIVSPTRACSSSPQNRENQKTRRPSNRQEIHGVSQHERTYRSENEPPLGKKTAESEGVAWHIPVELRHGVQKVPKEMAHKILPLQENKLVNNTLLKKTAERPLHIEELEPLHGWQKERNVDHKVERPHGIPNELWKQVVHNDALASKLNHWDVDPLMDRVQYILNKHSHDSSAEEDKGNLSEKHMSLQEAFLAYKQSFISKCKERQKRLALSSEHRKMQEYLRLEREALFLDQERMTTANVNAHPYSDNLFQPRRRLFSKQEMKELTMKRYRKLPEVLQKQESDKRIEQCKINRLRVNIFNKKVQRELLRKQSLRRL